MDISKGQIAWFEHGKKYKLCRVLSVSPFRAIEMKSNADIPVVVGSKLVSGVFQGGEYQPNAVHPLTREKRAAKLAELAKKSRARMVDKA